MANDGIQLREATANLNRATQELQKFNESTAAEVGKLVGKNIGDVAQKFTAGFEQIPGVQTLGTVGKTLFNKGFASLKNKREERLLRERLGITKQEFDQLKQQEKVRKAQEDLNKQFKEGADSLLGVNVEFGKTFEKIEMNFNAIAGQFQNTAGKIDENGKKVGGKFVTVGDAIEEQQKGVQKNLEGQRKSLLAAENRLNKVDDNFEGFHKQNQKLLDNTENSILSMVDGQKEMIKAVDKPAETPEIPAPIVNVPEVTPPNMPAPIVNVPEVPTEGITNAFQGFANKLGIGDSFKEALDSQTATQSALDLKGKAKDKEIANESTRADKRQENIFKKIAGNLGFLKDSAEEGQDENKGFFGNLISKFAGFRIAIMGLPAMLVAMKASLVAFGAALAPLAVPIAIGAAALLGFVAFIKGFIKGFGEGGFFGGVKEGLMEVFDWFVGFPLRLLKNLTTFVLRFLGFDALADDIDAAFEPFLSALRGIFGVLTDVLILPIVTIGRTIAGMFEGLFDMLMAPINGILTALTGVFDGIGKIIDGISMIFSGDIMGGLQMIFDGVITSIVGVIDGVVVFVTELFGGFFDILLSPFKAIYDTLGDLFFNPTSHVGRIVAWIGETFGGFFDFITKPFRGLYDLVAGIFTFDLEQIGNGIFKLVGGLFDLVTAPFRSIFNLISSIFDFDFLGYLATLPGVKQVMSVIKGVTGFFTSNEEEDTAKEERDAANKKARASAKKLKDAQRREDIVRTGNLQINGQNATPEQRAQMVDRYEGAKLGAQIDHSGDMIQLKEAQDRYAEVMNKTTLPELVSNASESMRSALFGANENTIAKIQAEKEAALAKQEKSFAMFNRGEELISDEEVAERLQKTRDEYDLKLQTEMDKGMGMFKTIGNFFEGLFNFDFMGMIKDIPGVSTVLGFLGMGGDKSLDDAIKDKEDYISSLKKDVANDGFFETKSNREKDKLALAEAMKELEDMRAEQAGQVTVVNNNNVVNANTNTSNNQTTTVPLRDTTPPAGTLTPAFADF